MSDMPLRDLERELVLAAERRSRAGRRLPSRRTLLLAAAVAVLIAVPAWATGLLRAVFPPDHHRLPGGQTGYLVASGKTDRGESWRFELTHGLKFRDGSKSVPCVAFLVGSRRGFTQCTGPRSPGALSGAVGTVATVSARDHRRLLIVPVPLKVKSVAVRFRSGRELRVLPLAVDQARAHRTGIPFPGGLVAVAFAPHDGLAGFVSLDAHGRPIRVRGMGPSFSPSPHARVVRSPVI